MHTLKAHPGRLPLSLTWLAVDSGIWLLSCWNADHRVTAHALARLPASQALRTLPPTRAQSRSADCTAPRSGPTTGSQRPMQPVVQRTLLPHSGRMRVGEVTPQPNLTTANPFLHHHHCQRPSFRCNYTRLTFLNYSDSRSAKITFDTAFLVVFDTLFTSRSTAKSLCKSAIPVS